MLSRNEIWGFGIIRTGYADSPVTTELMLAFTLDFPDFRAGNFLNSKHRSIGIKGPYDEKSSLSETKHNPGNHFYMSVTWSNHSLLKI
jgi:hypothetical protein